MRSAPWMDPARSGGTSASSRSQAALPPCGTLGMPWAVGSGAAATPAGDKAHSSSCSCRLQGDQGEAVEGGVGATGIPPPHPRPEFWGCKCGFGCSLADLALPGRRRLPASALLSPALPRRRGGSLGPARGKQSPAPGGWGRAHRLSKELQPRAFRKAPAAARSWAGGEDEGCPCGAQPFCSSPKCRLMLFRCAESTRAAPVSFKRVGRADELLPPHR